MGYTWYLAWTCCCTGVDRKNHNDLVPVVPKKYNRAHRLYNKSIDSLETARSVISEKLYGYASDDVKDKIDMAYEFYQDPDKVSLNFSPRYKNYYDKTAYAVGGAQKVLEKKQEV